MKNVDLYQNWMTVVGFMGEKINGFSCEIGKDTVVTDYVELRLDPKEGSKLFDAYIEYTEEDWKEDYPEAEPFYEKDEKWHGDYSSPNCEYTMHESIDRIVAYVHFNHDNHEFNTIFFEAGSANFREDISLEKDLSVAEMQEIIDYAKTCVKNDLTKANEFSQWMYSEDAEDLGVIDVKENTKRVWKMDITANKSKIDSQITQAKESQNKNIEKTAKKHNQDFIQEINL